MALIYGIQIVYNHVGRPILLAFPPTFNIASSASKSSATNNGRVLRKLGANSEVTISIEDIKRNEIREIEKISRDGSKYRRFRLNHFDAPACDVVFDLESMTTVAKTEYLAKSYFEIVIDDRSLNSVSSVATVLDQILRLTPVLNKAKNLMIHIQVPDRGCFTTANTEYMKSPTRQFLLQVAQQLRSFNSLKHMDIVLGLVKKFDKSKHANLTVYILPFYELQTFTRWRVKYQEEGTFPPQLVSIVCIRRIEKKNAELVEEEKKQAKAHQEEQERIESAVFFRKSAYFK